VDDANEIGSRLIASFRETFSEQVQKALARRIHAKVRDARSDPDRAARRWPFELIQNAHDAGEREGRTGIAVAFDYVDGVLSFEHDAAPFTMSDIAALLTGGSSKDFDSQETTGRFGTGFLVTHALSERVVVAGILEADGAHRSFEVTLDRPDDEELILRNINDSVSTLGRTTAIASFADVPTAQVRYVVDDEDTALGGLSMLEEALPHLFASCRRLGEVRIRRYDASTTWRVHARSTLDESEGVLVNEVKVRSVDGDRATVDWRVLRAAAGPDSRGGLLVALRRDEEIWATCKPGQVPSVFRQLPVLGAPVLSTWVIIDGEFDVDEERSSIHVMGEHGRPLREAFDALGGLALLAVRERWLDGYRVAQLASPAESLGEGAANVWRDVLSGTARALAELPLVGTVREGRLPAVQCDSHERHADFIERPSDGPSHDELWSLAAACRSADPPEERTSKGWSEIVEGWEALGVPIHTLDLKAIGERASSGCESVAELDVQGEPYDWLVEYLEAVGRTWQANDAITKGHVAGLLPDQHGHLRSAGDLRRDGGVSDRVKEIAAGVGLDIKAQLLDQTLVRMVTDQGQQGALEAINEATGDDFDDDEAVQEIVRHIAEALPADRPVAAESRHAAAASIALLEYLWDAHGADARRAAWEVPLLASDAKAYRAGHRRLMLPPVGEWPDKARPFALAFPPDRVLADDYTGAEDSKKVLEALAEWGIAHHGILEMGQREELADRGLRAIVSDPEGVADARLQSAEMMQISLLEPEVINSAKHSREKAQALLGLVVCYVAPEDESWRSTVEMSVRTPDGNKPVQLTPSLWLADLRSKPWIPVEEEDDLTHHVPNPELLRELIDPRWLEGNRDGADLLVRHFDMDALDVRLLAAAGDDEARQRLRDGLARIVEITGDDPQAIEDLAAKAEQRLRDVSRMRNLGLAVQACVKAELQGLNLVVEDVDRGYDFLVTAVGIRDEDPDELAACFNVGEHKVEVKTTTVDEVRLTPLQARTAVNEPGAFVLCVVDLRDFEGDVHQVDWTGADITDRCRFVAGQDLPIDETLALVQDAEGSEVPIRNATALRYAIGSDMWNDSLGLEEWVQKAFGPDSSAATGSDG
jgi:hypothetical protein